MTFSYSWFCFESEKEDTKKNSEDFELYSVDPLYFSRWGRIGTRRESSMKIRNPSSDCIREKKVSYFYYILLNNV